MNSSDICRALKKRYGSNEATAIAFEVAESTGHAAKRRIDAVVMELWPSRGLALHALEIKVSRSDLKRELVNGAKAEAIAQYCDFFSIVAPAKLVKPENLPSAWGLIEIDGNENVVIKKAAVKTKAVPLTRAFMASMLRSNGKGPAAELEQATAKIRAQIYEGYNAEIERRMKLREGDGAKWKELEAKLKEAGAPNYLGTPEVLNAVAMVLKSGVASTYLGLTHLQKELAQAAERIDTATKSLNLETETKK